MDKWIRLFADVVREKRMTIEEVPEKYRKQVKELLEKEGV